jgi:hypothetical protein
MGRLAVRNGELLKLVSESFDAFVTLDRNLAFQQPVASFPVSVIVLRARTSRIKDLELLVPALLKAIETAKPGTVQFIES